MLAGTKWTATKWIHTKPFNPEWLNNTNTDPEILPEDCKVFLTNDFNIGLDVFTNAGKKELCDPQCKIDRLYWTIMLLNQVLHGFLLITTC